MADRLSMTMKSLPLPLIFVNGTRPATDRAVASAPAMITSGTLPRTRAGDEDRPRVTSVRSSQDQSSVRSLPGAPEHDHDQTGDETQIELEAVDQSLVKVDLP